MSQQVRQNFYIPKLRYANVENFTSPLGIQLRRLISPLLCLAMRAHLSRQKHIRILSQPGLPKDEPFIFASNHSFADDIATAILSIDRHVYLLTNSVDQLNINPEMYAAWLNGMIFVDTRNAASRKDSLPKMQKVLAHGSSVLMFPEGSWNISENKTVGRVFPGTCVLARRTGHRVVPMAQYHDLGSKEVLINFGQPLDLASLSVKEGMSALRDALATLRYEIMVAHTVPVQRSSLPPDARMRHRDSFMNEMSSLTWRNPDWEDEFRVYEGDHIPQDQVWGFVDQLDLNPRNAKHLAWIKAERQSENRFDVVRELEMWWASRKAGARQQTG